MVRKIIPALAMSAVILFCLMVFSNNKAELDLWGNVGFVTAWPWQEGFKYLNTFSFTEPGHPWVNHEWFAEYILNRLYTYAGNPGLLLFKILIGLCVAGMLYRVIKRAGVSGSVAFLWLILTVSTIGYGFSTRPHLFTYLFYTFFLFVLWSYRRTGARSLWLLPGLAVIWTNLHGAFFSGLILLVTYTACETLKGWLPGRSGEKAPHIKPLIMVTLLFFAATFMTPFGARLWSYIFYSGSILRPYLSEWAPMTDLAYFAEHIDFTILAAISFSALFFSRKPKDMTWLAIFFLSFIAAMALRRNIPLFAITAAFVVPPYLEDAAGAPLARLSGKIPRALIAALLVIFGAVSLFHISGFRRANPLEIEIPQDSFPVGVVSFMKANEIAGNALVFFDWAEYCIWKLYPKCRVFLDGRFCSAYSVKTIDTFFDFLYARGDWKAALDAYPVDIVLIHKGNPVYAKMLALPEWEYIYEDRIGALFMKKTGNKDFFSRMEKKEVLYPRVAAHEYFP